MNYYEEIKDTLIKNEAYKRVKDYSKNRSDLNAYFEVGRLIVEAQGGEARAKYGDKLIKEYSDKLTKELGKGYSVRSLKYMRRFYQLFVKRQALPALLNWSHCIEILKLNDMKCIEYYINMVESQNLSYRELRKRIKSNEYERIGYKMEMEKPKINTLIKNPITINTHSTTHGNKISEKLLHEFIVDDMDNFLKELGIGFSYIGHEVKIKINNTYHFIDFLLYNYEFNCFVICEIKVTKMKPEYIGQVLKYINYVDKNIKKSFQDDTVGIVICKNQNQYVMEYCTNPNIFTTTYNLINN